MEGRGGGGEIRKGFGPLYHFRPLQDYNSACCMLHVARCHLLVNPCLLLVARCSLFVECCSLLVVRCSLNVARCLLFIVR